jgi:Fic/DOC family
VADHLRVWCGIREILAWDVDDVPKLPDSPIPANGQPGGGGRDGVAHYIRTVENERDPARAERMSAALALMHRDAADGRDLDFAALAGWQSLVLGVDNPAFRTGPAYAKGGRERYGIEPGTPDSFERCLAQSSTPDLPLPARAARAYLDVCFFHPFDDGNARAALLALAFVLARGGVVLDQVGPIQLAARYADDPESALELARLVAVLTTAARRRAAKQHIES